MKKSLLLTLTLFLSFLIGETFGQTVTLAKWEFEDVVSATSVDANVTASNATVSSLTIAFQNGADDGGLKIGNSGTWNTGNFDPAGKYLQFSVSANAGYGILLEQVNLRFGRTAAGPTKVTVQYSLDGFATAGITILNDADVSSTNAAALDPFTLTTGFPDYAASQTITFRVFGHNAVGTGNLRFNNLQLLGQVKAVHPITILPVIGGTADVTTIPALNAEELEIVTVNISNIQEGREFVSITGVATDLTPIVLTEVIAGIEYTFTMPAQGVNIEVTLTETVGYLYTLNTVIAGGSADFTTTPATSTTSGTTVTLDISNIEAGKQFLSLVVVATDLTVISTTEVTPGVQYTFTMPAQSVTATLTLEDIVYPIATNVTGGTALVTTTPATEAVEAATVTVSISGIEVGKQFLSIDVIAADLSVISTTEVTPGTEYTFLMPAQAVTINVVLEDIPVFYTINNTVIGGTATITTLPAIQAEELDVVTVTISDIEVGKQFLSIDVVGADLTPITTTMVSAGVEYTFIMPAQDVTVTITLEDIPITYVISTNVIGGIATITTTPAMEAEELEVVTATISGIEVGKQFLSIDVIGADLTPITTTLVTAGVEYTFEMPAQAVSVNVTLEDIPVITYAITTNVIGGTATVTTAPATEAEELDVVTVTISGIEVGKQFLSIDVIGADLTPITTTLVTAGVEYTFEMPAQAVSVNVTLEDIPVITYAITTNTFGGTATVTTAPTTEAEELEVVTVTISGIEVGKQFLSIDVIGADLTPITTTLVTAGVEYTFEMPAQAVSVNVTLEDIPVVTYAITSIVTGGTATITTLPAIEAEEAELVTVTISDIEAGKHFLSIDVIGEDLTPITTTIVNPEIEYTFVMPAQAVEINVTIEDIPVTYQITTTVMGGTATVVTAPAAIAEENDNVIVTISNIEVGKEFGMIEVWAEDVEIPTTEVLAGVEYSFIMPAIDVDIYVHLQDIILEPIIINAQPESVAICAGSFAVLSIDATSATSETLTYQWYFDSLILTDSTESSITVSEAGEYYCLLTAGLDELSSDIATVTVNPLPVIDLGANQILCDGLSLEITAPVAESYLWNTEETTQTITIDTAGTYICTITDINGCTNSDQMTLSIIASPNVDLGEDITIDEDQILILGTQTGHPTYAWSTGATTDFIEIDASTLTLGAHSYSVTVTGANGCISEDEVIITVIPGAGINTENLNNYSIFPNPTSGIIEINGNEIISIDIFDNIGRNILTTDESRIDLSSYSKGLYSVRINSKEGSYTSKLIIL